jgi:hypothetical protein
MKYIKYLIVFSSLYYQSFCQTPGEIDNVSATIIPKVKNYFITTVNGEVIKMRKDTGYTLVLLLKTNNIALTDKLIIRIGEQQNSDDLMNLRLKVVDQGNNKRAMHDDNPPNLKLDEIKFGFVQLYFDITLNDYSKLKWITAFVKNGNIQSQKKYYGFE